MRPETGPARIALVTDAWEPQMNGVVRTLTTTVAILRGWGHEVLVISPDGYRSFPCPTYSEIRLAMASRFGVGRRLEAFAPDAVPIATEGPVGLAAPRPSGAPPPPAPPQASGPRASCAARHFVNHGELDLHLAFVVLLPPSPSQWLQRLASCVSPRCADSARRAWLRFLPS